VVNIPKDHKNTTGTKYIPNGHKIYPMIIKYTR
jgi:hypothetical protein